MLCVGFFSPSLYKSECVSLEKLNYQENTNMHKQKRKKINSEEKGKLWANFLPFYVVIKFAE